MRRWLFWLVLGLAVVVGRKEVWAGNCACACAFGGSGGTCTAECNSSLGCVVDVNNCEVPAEAIASGTCSCRTDARSCCSTDDYTGYKTCDASGTWGGCIECTAGYGCSGGYCNQAPPEPTDTPVPTNTPVPPPCDPGPPAETQCSNGQKRTCVAGGEWGPWSNCATLMCSGNACYSCEDAGLSRVNTGGQYGGTCTGGNVYCEKQCNWVTEGCSSSQDGYKDVICWTTQACWQTERSKICSRTGAYSDPAACPYYYGCTCKNGGETCVSNSDCCSNVCYEDPPGTKFCTDAATTPIPTSPQQPTPTTYCQPYLCVNVDPGGICPYSTPPFGFCGSPNTAASCDNCGGVSCNWCAGAPTPPPGTPVPTANPTPCNCYAGPNPTTAAGVCANSTFECNTDPSIRCYGNKTSNECSCVVQGYKVIMPGNQVVAPATTQTVSVDGFSSSTSSPYSISVGANTGNQDVSVSVPNGYSANYTYCANAINCHVYPTVTLIPGASAGNILCPTGVSGNQGFADLWWHFDPPKTASVNIGATAIAIGESVSVGVSGNAYIQSPGHTMRLWLEKWSTGSSIPSAISYKVGTSTYGPTPYVGSYGEYYYNLSNINCTSSAYTNCSSSGYLWAPPAGSYRLHVDIPTDPRKCSGNVLASYNGGPYSYSGWVGCGSYDSVSLCVDSEDCSPVCGQTKSCGGTCASTDATAPGTVTIAAPRGATTAPTPYATPSLTLRWDAESSGYTDQYRYQVFRWATPGVGTTMINTTVGSGVTGIGTTIGVGMTGVIYQWKVRAENTSCNGYPAGSTYGGWSTSGYYCWEGESCSLQCGQDRNCPGNGSCSSTDATTPGQVTKVAPLGVTSAPTPYTTPSLNLQWNNNESNHSYTDNYRYQVFRWATPGVGTTMINTTVGSGVTGVGTTIGVGMTGVTYEWKIRAENSTCNGYPAGSTYGTWSSSGYYCWEGELCVLGNQCGQARDCAGNGNCPNTDGGTPGQVTILSPTGPNISNPTVYNDVSTLNLQWQNSEVGHTYTDFYNYQVIKVGGSNPSNIGTTFYGVGSTVARTVASVGISGTRGDIYEWQVRAGNNNCSPVIYGVGSSWGFFVLNRTPTTPLLTVTNNVGTTVLAESYGVGQSGNHICDTRFTSRQARFVVNAYDLDGGNTINEVELKFGAVGWVRGVGLTGAAPSWSTSGGGLSFYTTPSTSTSGNRRTVIFPVEMSTSFSTAIYDLTIDTVDMWGRARNDIDTNRDFKNWDCQVLIASSYLYDSSSTNGPACPNTGYSNLYIGTSFTSLIFDGPGTDNPAMNVRVPNNFSSGGTLTWGANYLPTFNADLDMTDPTGGQRVVDLGNLGNGTTSCPGGMLTVNNTVLSAYSDNPSLQIDFSGIQDQEPWYQAVGGGIRARTRVICNVPPTCRFNPSCRPGMSIDSVNLAVGESDNGLVSAVAIDDSNGCNFLNGDCHYGMPSDWYLNDDIWGENYTYQFLYDKYFGGLGLGVTYPSGTKISDIGGTGVVFINGDFEVDEGNSLTNNQFLMMVVRGEVVVDSTVTAISGIVVADGGVRVEGVSNSQLVISGMLYSAISDINLTRGYTDKSSNNASPAIVVNYRPSLIFNMPADLVKILSGWREGN